MRPRDPAEPGSEDSHKGHKHDDAGGRDRSEGERTRVLAEAQRRNDDVILTPRQRRQGFTRVSSGLRYSAGFRGSWQNVGCFMRDEEGECETTLPLPLRCCLAESCVDPESCPERFGPSGLPRARLDAWSVATWNHLRAHLGHAFPDGMDPAGLAKLVEQRGDADDPLVEVERRVGGPLSSCEKAILIAAVLGPTTQVMDGPPPRGLVSQLTECLQRGPEPWGTGLVFGAGARRPLGGGWNESWGLARSVLAKLIAMRISVTVLGRLEGGHQRQGGLMQRVRGIEGTGFGQLGADRQRQWFDRTARRINLELITGSCVCGHHTAQAHPRRHPQCSCCQRAHRLSNWDPTAQPIGVFVAEAVRGLAQMPVKGDALSRSMLFAPMSQALGGLAIGHVEFLRCGNIRERRVCDRLYERGLGPADNCPECGEPDDPAHNRRELRRNLIIVPTAAGYRQVVRVVCRLCLNLLEADVHLGLECLLDQYSAQLKCPRRDCAQWFSVAMAPLPCPGCNKALKVRCPSPKCRRKTAVRELADDTNCPRCGNGLLPALEERLLSLCRTQHVWVCQQ